MAHRLQQLGCGAQSSRPPGSGAQALSCGAGAQVLCCVWDPPRSGSRPVSPARAGRFSPTEPPGSPSRCEFKASARGAGWFLSSPAQLPGCAVDQGLTAGLQ